MVKIAQNKLVNKSKINISPENYSENNHKDVKPRSDHFFVPINEETILRNPNNLLEIQKPQNKKPLSNKVEFKNQNNTPIDWKKNSVFNISGMGARVSENKNIKNSNIIHCEYPQPPPSLKIIAQQISDKIIEHYGHSENTEKHFSIVGHSQGGLIALQVRENLLQYLEQNLKQNEEHNKVHLTGNIIILDAPLVLSKLHLSPSTREQNGNNEKSNLKCYHFRADIMPKALTKFPQSQLLSPPHLWEDAYIKELLLFIQNPTQNTGVSHKVVKELNALKSDARYNSFIESLGNENNITVEKFKENYKQFFVIEGSNHGNIQNVFAEKFDGNNHSKFRL